MPLGKARQRVVFGLSRARGVHRYTYWRWGIGIVLTLAIAALPAFDVLRFDLWQGRHRVLGRDVGLVEAAKAFAFSFLAVNVAIIIASRWVGRYLCGFVCPYGSIARLAEWLRFRSKSRAQRLGAAVLLLASCALLAAIALAFWVDPRVLFDGSTRAVVIVSTVYVGLFAGFSWMAWILALRFCRDWCPSGVYFALLGHETRNAVELAHPSSCTSCGACEKACPMDLLPRAMSTAEQRAGTGLYPDGASSFALCIRCGDCVAACEGMTARSDDPTPLRMGFLSADAHRSSPSEASAHGE
jgi:polyferredoxin